MGEMAGQLRLAWRRANPRQLGNILGALAAGSMVGGVFVVANLRGHAGNCQGRGLGGNPRGSWARFTDRTTLAIAFDAALGAHGSYADVARFLGGTGYWQLAQHGNAGLHPPRVAMCYVLSEVVSCPALTR